MRKRKIMIVGPTQSGKSTLANMLNGEDKPLRRTQDTVFGKEAIDVPASYIENRTYKHLIALAQNSADCVVLIVNQDKPTAEYSPGFSRVFTCPVIGVISKAGRNMQNREYCKNQLRRSGINPPYFLIDERGGQIEELKEYIRQLRLSKEV